MTDGIDPATPPQDTGPPDPVERDPATLNSAEDLDEDRLRLDPLEEGMDPPEHWSEADKYGTTPFEQSHRSSVGQRLREEEPDITSDDQPIEDPTAIPDDELDDSIDDLTLDVEPLPPDGPSPESTSRAARSGQSADEAGGSIAEEIRTPQDRPT